MVSSTNQNRCTSFKETRWLQNNRKETVILGKTVWLVCEDGCVSKKHVNLEGEETSHVIIKQHLKGVPKQFLCLPTGEYVHRIVALAFVPNPDAHKNVRFIDGNPFHVNASNLEWHTVKKKGIKLGKRNK